MTTRILCGFYTAILLVTTLPAQAQSYPFPTDSLQRGYYNRPYQRYEAEPALCTTDGTFLSATDDQAYLQSEASHQQALQLTSSNSFVQWVIDQPGDGLTIRFSLPDNELGTGNLGQLTIYADGDSVGILNLNSYWAWQYTVKGGTYPTNTPATPGGGNVVRMRFDEIHTRLLRTVNQGEVLQLVKTAPDSLTYTIDFIELEPVPAKVTFAQVQATYPAAIAFAPATDGDLAAFVENHRGATIYLPEGKIETSQRIYFNRDSMRLIGAGMWYTEVYFNAPSDNLTTYSRRGIESYRSHLLVEGLYLNTVNNQRYYNNDDSKQVGKGFNGSFGKHSVIRDCWVEHFECGAWFGNYSGDKCDSLTISHCRFRNNYADGVNCSKGMKNVTLDYCSFRNNGDDDMASWSTGGMARNIVFAYCTAENNWRASSLGFFGGSHHHAHHLYIVDGLECGVRVNADFAGNGFSATDTIAIHDITIAHCGCLSGTRGNQGDFWGNMQGALNIGSGGNYDVQNIAFDRIDILDSRSHAIYICKLNNNKQFKAISLRDIAVQKAPYNGIYFSSSAKGTIRYCTLTFEDVKTEMNTVPSSLTWEPLPDCLTPLSEITSPFALTDKCIVNQQLLIRFNDTYYDTLGRRHE